MPEGAPSLSARDRLILPIDTPALEEARRLVDELYEYVGVFKIGLELLMNEGPAAVSLVRDLGLKLFLDGKFLDIPNTVAQATEAVARQGVQMLTVHATGGGKMLAACARAAQAGARQAGHEPPIVLGVTVLTSLTEQMLKEELNVGCSVSEQVLSLAGLCQKNGVTGIVASAQEVAALRSALGKAMVLVTPGVRPSWAEANDQSRVVTPAQALRNGSDYLVIGRPITAAAQRKEAAQRIIAEMEEALAAV